MNGAGKPRIMIVENAEEAAAQAVAMVVTTAGDSVARRGHFTLAISGGSTPQRMYRMLVSPPSVDLVPWEKTHFFWVDERCVPPADPQSNYGMAWRDFLRDAPLPERNIHPMRCQGSPEESAARMELELRGFFHLGPWDYPIFDLICLGMGKDGHTASLFPNHEGLNEARNLVAAVKGGTPAIHRLTLSLPVLNRGRAVLFLVTGREKAEMVKEVLMQAGSHRPAAMICPLSGNLTWLLDREAACLLGRGTNPG